MITAYANSTTTVHFRVSHIRPERRGSDTTVWSLETMLPLNAAAPARYGLAGALRLLADEIEDQ